MSDDQTVALATEYPLMAQRADELPEYREAVDPRRLPRSELRAEICCRRTKKRHVLAVLTRAGELVTPVRSYPLDATGGVPAFCPKCPIQHAEWAIDPVKIRRMVDAYPRRPLNIDVRDVGRLMPELIAEARRSAE